MVTPDWRIQDPGRCRNLDLFLPEEQGGMARHCEVTCKKHYNVSSSRYSLFLTQNGDDAKVILTNTAQHVGQSVKIWLAAANLEHDVKAKQWILRKGTLVFALIKSSLRKGLALEHIPNSVHLWKETVNLETSPVDAHMLLSRAVEVIPFSVELWLALARLETPDKAKSILNKARKAIPTSHEIWIAAGQLLK